MYHVKEVINNNKNCSLFRQIARDSSGETFAPPEGERVYFVYERRSPNNETLVAVGSYRRASLTATEPAGGQSFDDQFCHMVSYLFVKSRLKGRGIGSQLLRKMIRDMLSYKRRAIRVQSAAKAVGFFERHGFQQVGPPIETVCGGSPLFACLYNMERT